MRTAKAGRTQTLSKLESLTRAMQEAQQRYGRTDFIVAFALVCLLAVAIMFSQDQLLQAGTAEALRIEYKTIVTATQTYLADHNKYPASAEELAASGYIASVPTLASYTIDNTGKITQIQR